MKQPVLRKSDFVKRFMRDEFGNKGPNWGTLDEWKASGYKGLVHIRSKRPSDKNGQSPYNVPMEEVEQRCKEIRASPDTHYLAGMAPSSQTLFQGEVQVLPISMAPEDIAGLYLRFSTVAKPMREALAEQAWHAQGIMASWLLKRYMDPTSYDWLQELLDEYPGHVIEFSVYDCYWGTLPSVNTVFWEVRLY